MNNVTHLDPMIGIQVTSSLMEAVERDVVYQRILEEVGKRTKAELQGLPRDHPALHHKHMWESFSKCPLPNGKFMIQVDGTHLYIPTAEHQGCWNNSMHLRVG